MTLFGGIGAAMVTPFSGDGINYPVLKRYIEYLISGGVAAVIPFGTTGEPATVTQSEYKTAVPFIVKCVRGRVPVIVGAGSNSTAQAVKNAILARELGADGILAVTPYYNKCTERGIVEHYKAIVKAAEIPVIAYNVPSRTGVNIAPNTLEKLKKIGVVGIKEASGDINQITKTAKVCAEVGLDMYCGDDGLTAVEAALGAVGAISVAANPAPKKMCELFSLCASGNYPAARKLMFELDGFIRTLFCEVNPIPVKKAMQLLGFAVGKPRLPLTELEREHTELLKYSMRELGLIK